MEEQVQKQVVTIDGHDYDVNELPNEVKGALVQIQYTREEMNHLQVQFQNMNMMQRGYVMLLNDLMKQWKEGETVVSDADNVSVSYE